ncbi:hypothetical protein V6N13_108627 [Hibiscus sabdariffa]
MSPASSAIASPLTTTSLQTSRPQVRLHRSLQSCFLVKATICRSMKGFLSDGQWLYLRNYDIEGRMESCLATRVYAEWALQSENWLHLQPQPVHLHNLLRKLYQSSLSSIRPPPKPPHISGCTIFGSPILLSLPSSADLGLARERCHRNRIVRFSKSIGICTVSGERFKGLQCAWDLGKRQVSVELDNLSTVHMLHGQRNGTAYSSLW